jgi:hypothetical protein
MSSRKPAETGLTSRQRLSIFHGSALGAEAALTVDESALDFEYLLTNGVKALNLMASGLRPLAMKRLLKLEEPAQLRRLGFDALHLVDHVWCNEATAAYGAKALVEAFLVAPRDAVCLSGSDAVSTLDVSTEQLLAVCAGAPVEAIAVVEQCKTTNPLKGVRLATLLDTGLRAPQLKQLGFTLASIRQLSDVTNEGVKKLGFTM